MKTQSARMGFLILLLVLTAAITACGAASPAPAGQMVAMDKNTASMESAPPEPGASAGGSDADENAPALDVAPQPRVIIYTGNVELVVKDTDQAVNTIVAMTKELGGYVAQTNVYNDNGVPRGQIVIRVPAESYQTTLKKLRETALRVERENTSSQDVTEEYVDLEARKINLEKTEAALQNILDLRQKTGNIEDVLSVYRELTNVREQIEQIQGRMNYLSRSAAMSTITVNLTPDVLTQPITVAGWEPKGVARDAVRALISAAQTWVEFWIWMIVVILPVLVLYLAPVVLVLWILWRLWKSNRAKKRAQKAPEAAKEPLPPQKNSK